VPSAYNLSVTHLLAPESPMIASMTKTITNNATTITSNNNHVRPPTPSRKIEIHDPVSSPPNKLKSQNDATPSRSDQKLLRKSINFKEGLPEYIVEKYDTFFLDCDGTIYEGEKLLPNAAETIDFLVREKKKRVCFVTNTSSRDGSQLALKLNSMGISSADCDNAYPSGAYAADFIRRAHPRAKKVYVVGGGGLKNELRRRGFETQTERSDAAMEPFDAGTFSALNERTVRDEQYDGVVVGLDTRLNYGKIVRAVGVLGGGKNPTERAAGGGAGHRKRTFFYASNDDAYDIVDGWFVPGTGGIVEMLNHAASKMPHRAVENCPNDGVEDRKNPFGPRAVVLGKPNPDWMRYLLEKERVDVDRAVMIGDRLDTDVLFGNGAGVSSILVLTGVHGEEDVFASMKPTYILSGLEELRLDGGENAIHLNGSSKKDENRSF